MSFSSYTSLRLGLCLLLMAVPGCFKSLTLEASSESSSNSLSSPFESSSESSSPDDEVARDVRDATELWALGGGDIESLRRDVGRIAREYGVSDWESDAATFRAIGHGLRRSRLTGDTLESVKVALTGDRPEASTWIETGYGLEGMN